MEPLSRGVSLLSVVRRRRPDDGLHREAGHPGPRRRVRRDAEKGHVGDQGPDAVQGRPGEVLRGTLGDERDAAARPGEWRRRPVFPKEAP